MTISARSTVWKLGTYQRIQDAPSLSRKGPFLDLSAQAASTEALFDATERRDLDGIRNNITLIVNKTKRTKIRLMNDDRQMIRFYYTVSAGGRKVDSMHSMEIDTDIEIMIPRLSWALFTTQQDDSGSRAAILDLLLQAGAHCEARDGYGLCAYDHARILKLDQDTIRKLYPFPSYDGPPGGGNGLLDASRNVDIEGTMKYLDRLQSSHENELNESRYSPIALAVHSGILSAIPKMLAKGFSPFLPYIAGEEYYKPMACYMSSEAHSELQAELSRSLRKQMARLNDFDGALTMPLPALLSRALEVDCCSLRRQTLPALGLTYVHTETPPIVFSALLQNEGCVCACLSYLDYSPIPLDAQADVGRAVYAAIRAGHLDMVSMLSRKGRIMGSMGGYHPVISWWPWPCTCEDPVRCMKSRTLLE